MVEENGVAYGQFGGDGVPFFESFAIDTFAWAYGEDTVELLFWGIARRQVDAVDDGFSWQRAD